MSPRPSSAAPRRPRVPNSVLFKTLTASIVENLEQRYLLTADSPDANLVSVLTHMSDAERHAVAVLEYTNSDFQAKLDAALASVGLDPIPPEPGAITSDPGKSKHHRRPRPHKINLYHKPKRHHRRTDPAPPTVTNVNYYYDQPLPNQLAFTFDQDVTATNWNAALTVINLNTAATLSLAGTYSPALHTIVYDLNSSAILPDGNYAAILHADQITDTTHSLAVVGSDSVAGHDFQTSFYFMNADFNRDHQVSLADFSTLSSHYGHTTGNSFTKGDANYDGLVNSDDLDILSNEFGAYFPVLTSVTQPTAYIASSSSADIFWDAPSDPNVTAFDLYRNSTLLASGVTDTGYLESGLSYNTTYNYFVVSKDTYGNTAYESPEAYVAIAPSTPTVSLSGDAAVTEGDTYFLGGEFANANNDQPTAWSVDWGDGSSATYTGFASAVLDSSDEIGGPANAFHTYSNGVYTLSASALSDIGTYAAGSLVVAVSDATPTFSVLGDQTFVQGSAYSINPTFTDFDPGLSWTVVWGDGSSNSTGTGAIPGTLTHTYTSGASAPYTLNAYVTTTDGTYTNSATVDAAAPSLSITGSSSVQQGATYTLSRSFSDPAGLAPSAWSIDWGDGSSTTTAGSATTFTHTYSKLLSPGEPYTLAAYAVDPNGTYYAAPAQVTVNLTTPTLNLSAPATTVGNVVTVTNASTPNGGDSISQWTIAWGDGVSSFATGSATAFTHAYTLPGTFTLSATASTAHGNYTRTLPVSVADHASFSITAPSGTAGASYLLGVNFTDPGSTETPSSYFVNWGDGSTSTYSNPTQYEGSFSHQYSTYGTETLSVTATTSQGTYYQTAVASIAIPPLTLIPYAPQGNDAAENGEPYTLFVGPYGAQEPDYTVYWGDGQSSTDARWYTTHAYAYDPSPTANNQYVATLVCGYTIGYCAPIVYDSGGDGTASLSAESDTTTDGFLYSVTGTFSDPNQTPPTHYSGPSALYISWGDGQFSGAGDGFDHIYSHAGTYNIELDEVYVDDNSDPVTGIPIFDVITHKAVVVRPSTPAFDVFSTSGIHVDTTFSPTLYYDDSPYHDQTPQLWTIDWGDGQSTSHWGPLPGTFSHAYHQKGPMVINATLTTDYGVYHSAASLTVIGPTIAVTGGGVSATEGESSDPGFQISRGFATDKPLAVNFSLFGQATFGSDYQLLDPEGHILSSSIEIPAGQAFTDVIIHPVDDNVPEWTEPFTLSINPSPENAYAVSPTYNTATAEIVDNDLGIILGNGSANQVIQGSSDGKHNLIPLYIKVPQDPKSGANYTLSGPATLVDVWTTNPPSAPPVIGIDGANTHTSTTVTYSPNAPTIHTYWVGGLSGSNSFGDVVLSLSDSDAHANVAPLFPTVNSTTTKPATVISITILSLANPNDPGHPSTMDVTSNTSPRPWLVGQVVDLKALIHGPPQRQQPALTWNVPGQTLFDYQDDTHTAVATPLLGNNTFALPNGGALPTLFYGVGTSELEVRFFWVTDQDNPGNVSITVNSPLTGPLLASTSFSVTDPDGRMDVVSESPTRAFFAAYRSQSVVVLGAEFAPGGIVISGEVSMPVGFNGTGEWKFVQTVNTDTKWIGLTSTNLLLGQMKGSAELTSNNQVFLDADPYPGVYDQTFDLTDPMRVTDGNTVLLNDGPAVVLTGLNVNTRVGPVEFDASRIIVSDWFYTYLMFKAPGDSRYVPLGHIDWIWQTDVHRAGQLGVIDSAEGPGATEYSTRVTEPVWPDNANRVRQPVLQEQ